MPLTVLLTSSWSASSVGRFLYIFLIVAFVAILAYFSTKLMAAASRSGRYRGGGRNLALIESMGVGPQAMLQIIRSGGQYFLIGVTKERISVLAELDAGGLIIRESQGLFPGGAFDGFLKRFMKKNDIEEGADGKNHSENEKDI